MAMSVKVSASEWFAGSPAMAMPDLFSRDSLAPLPAGIETERTLHDRRDPSSTPTGWEAGGHLPDQAEDFPESPRGARRVSNNHYHHPVTAGAATTNNEPDVLAMAHVDPAEWHPYYMQCLQYFVEHGQNTSGVQALAAFLNIRLPYQRASTTTSLRLYIRRLIVTAHDSPDTLCAFFGDHWDAGIGPIRDQERINYLFTAKSSGWAETKTSYDILPDEHTPFLRPLREPLEEEIRTAEARWSEWLAMEDWMLGPRSPW